MNVPSTMHPHDAIINPVKGKKAPSLKPNVVIVSSETDLCTLLYLTDFPKNNFRKLMMSRIYPGNKFSLAGPATGAPYAVMILETLIAWGARRFLYFGWCGAILPQVQIGDIIVPTGAFIDEGTSEHYGADKTEPAIPSPLITRETKKNLKKNNLKFHEGNIWSLDAIYRETPENVSHYQTKNVLAVEMELSALFTVGKFRGVEVGGILVVSDELSTFTWKPGFKDERFRKGRRMVGEMMVKWGELSS